MRCEALWSGHLYLFLERQRTDVTFPALGLFFQARRSSEPARWTWTLGPGWGCSETPSPPWTTLEITARTHTASLWTLGELDCSAHGSVLLGELCAYSSPSDLSPHVSWWRSKPGMCCRPSSNSPVVWCCVVLWACVCVRVNLSGRSRWRSWVWTATLQSEEITSETRTQTLRWDRQTETTRGRCVSRVCVGQTLTSFIKS